MTTDLKCARCGAVGEYFRQCPLSDCTLESGLDAPPALAPPAQYAPISPEAKARSIDPVKLLKLACVEAGSQKGWALKNRVSPAYVNDVLRGRREPGDAICKALGIERVVTYRLASNYRPAD